MTNARALIAATGELFQAAVLTALVAAVSASPSHAVTWTWTGLGDGSSWNRKENWNPNTAYPRNNGTHYDATIPGGANVSVNTFADVDTVTVGSGATVNIQNLCRLGIEAGSLTNNGTLKLSGAPGDNCRLVFTGDATLSGSGRVEMSAFTSNSMEGDGANKVTSYNTISGAGRIGKDMGAGLSFANYGIIEATHSGAALTLDPDDDPAGGTGFFNYNILRAAGGWLEFEDGKYSNVASQIESDGAEAKVTFSSAAYITGGVIRSTNGGKLTVVAYQSNPATFRALELRGDVQVQENAALAIEYTIDNNASISLSGGAGSNRSNLYLTADARLTGSGTVALNESGNNLIGGIAPSGAFRTLSNEGNTIKGAGEIGSDSKGRLSIVNRGTIEANIAGKTLVIDPDETNPLGAFGNHGGGMLRATNGAYLELRDGAYDNLGGSIEAWQGSVVYFGDGVRISEGLLLTDVSSVMVPLPQVATPPRLSSVASHANINIRPNSALSLADEFSNWQSILMMANAVEKARLYVQTDLVLSGTGRILLVGGPNAAQILGVSGQRLTNGENLILGEGRIGDDAAGPLALTNRGTILADGAGTIHIDPVDTQDSFINEGLLHAKNNGTIQVDDGDLLNRGKVLVYAGGTLTVTGRYDQTAGETTIHGVMTVMGANPTFAAGTKVGGYGKINGKPANVWGTLGPGGSVGVLEFEGLNLMNGARLEFDIDGPAADLVQITGPGNAFQLEPGATYFLDVAMVSRDGMLNDYPLFAWNEGDPMGGRGGFESITWDLGRAQVTGRIVYLPDERRIVLADVQPVPEPGTLVLLAAAALAGVVPWLRRCSAARRRRCHQIQRQRNTPPIAPTP
jgi:hypothetical protein